MPRPPPLDEVTRARALAILDDQDLWRSIYPRLLRSATKKCGSRPEAEDLVEDALTAVRQGVREGTGRVWNPNRYPKLVVYMFLTIRSLAKHKAASAEAATEVFDEPNEETAERTADPALGPHERLRADHKLRRGNERLATVDARLVAKGDKIGRAVLQAVLDRDLDPKKLAKEFGVKPVEVYDAIRRVKDHMEASMKIHPDSSGPMPAAAKSTHEQEDAL